MLRRAFAAEVSSRLRKVKKLIWEAVVEQDVFGLAEKKDPFRVLQVPAARAYEFMTTSEKHDEFMGWLHEQNNLEILAISEGQARTAAGQVPWANKYVDSAYKRGMKRADEELVKKGITPSKFSADQLRGSNQCPKCDLNGANLSGARLNRADLSEANLRNADLSWANLNGAGLVGTDLSNADLSNANLSWSDLRGANLTEATLTRVNLTGSKLSGVTWTDGSECAEGSMGGCD